MQAGGWRTMGEPATHPWGGRRLRPPPLCAAAVLVLAAALVRLGPSTDPGSDLLMTTGSSVPTPFEGSTSSTTIQPATPAPDGPPASRPTSATAAAGGGARSSPSAAASAPGPP